MTGHIDWCWWCGEYTKHRGQWCCVCGKSEHEDPAFAEYFSGSGDEDGEPDGWPNDMKGIA